MASYRQLRQNVGGSLVEAAVHLSERRPAACPVEFTAACLQRQQVSLAEDEAKYAFLSDIEKLKEKMAQEEDMRSKRISRLKESVRSLKAQIEDMSGPEIRSNYLEINGAEQVHKRMFQSRPDRNTSCNIISNGQTRVSLETHQMRKIAPGDVQSKARRPTNKNKVARKKPQQRRRRNLSVSSGVE